MFKLFSSLSLSLSMAAALAAGCTDQPTAQNGDLVLDNDVSGIGKADHNTLLFEEVFAPISHDRLVRGGKAIVTSADSFEEYFGTPAPDDINFDNEWVAFYGLGTRNTGGYGASIASISNLPYWGGMILDITSSAPGADCFVTQAITWPHTLVKFAAPDPAPTWFSAHHEDETYNCGPTPDSRQTELAESLKKWEEARDAAANSYTYTSEFHSFLGYGGRTTIVVENGEVVERQYKAQHDNGSGFVGWTETGAEVGTHPEGESPVLVDELYRECAEEILTFSDETHWVHLAIDSSNGLMLSCTASDRLCNDDCSRGPNIATISF